MTGNCWIPNWSIRTSTTRRSKTKQNKTNSGSFMTVVTPSYLKSKWLFSLNRVRQSLWQCKCFSPTLIHWVLWLLFYISKSGGSETEISPVQVQQPVLDRLGTWSPVIVLTGLFWGVPFSILLSFRSATQKYLFISRFLDLHQLSLPVSRPPFPKFPFYFKNKKEIFLSFTDTVPSFLPVGVWSLPMKQGRNCGSRSLFPDLSPH